MNGLCEPEPIASKHRKSTANWATAEQGATKGRTIRLPEHQALTAGSDGTQSSTPA
jgi:hypothetical protein